MWFESTMLLRESVSGSHAVAESRGRRNVVGRGVERNRRPLDGLNRDRRVRQPLAVDRFGSDRAMPFRAPEPRINALAHREVSRRRRSR